VQNIEQIAVIDIGSNSVRLILVALGDKGDFKIINDIKESVRLENSLCPDGSMDPGCFDMLLKTLRAFRSLCDAIQPDEIWTVATEAFRKIINQQEVLQHIFEATGFEVRVLSGDEEAFLDYMAVIHSVDFTDGLIIDIGGGSTELMWVKDKELKEKTSLPIGAINLTRKFDLWNQVAPEQERALQQYLFQQYRQIPWLWENKHRQLIGIGGSMRNLGKIDRKRKQYPIDYAHHYHLEARDVQEIYCQVNAGNLAQRRRIKGLSRERADIFVGPMAAVSVLVDTLGIRHITISGYGLREGLIYTHLLNLGFSLDHPLDISIRNQLAKYNLNEKHALTVYKLTDSLCSQLRNLLNLDPGMEKVVKTASMLHNLGIGIRYYNQDKHTFYMILNCGLNGLSHRELLLSAHIAASHYKEDYKLEPDKYPGLLTEADCGTVKKLGVLLKIAESLDRTGSGHVQEIACKLCNDKVVIKVLGPIYPEWELETAQKCAPQFKKLFNKDLSLVYRPK
jgi:exopolyphosphatase/guanosine-5'-triphosphate,3'-diphosphate pyrophosphatase